MDGGPGGDDASGGDANDGRVGQDASAADGLGLDGVGADGGGCVPGSTASCKLAYLGVCAVGERSCVQDDAGSTWSWSSCKQLVKPGDRKESLADGNCGNLEDDDCDGKADDADEGCFECTPGQSKDCDAKLPGVCATGKLTCGSGGKWGSCQVVIKPGDQTETCGNALDDDCDGQVDADDSDCQACSPSATRKCTSSHPGVCADGTQTCVLDAGGGQWSWGTCEPTIKPGEQTESLAVSGSCSNGKDDDCDGKQDAADDGCYACNPTETRSCTSGQPGICSAGTETCNQSGQWGGCVADVSPGSRSEDCSTAQDEDCDGKVGPADTDCQSCTPGVTASCSLSFFGICGVGEKTCTLNNAGTRWEWSSCRQLVTPGQRSEDCSTTVDEDCDGQASYNDSDCQSCVPNSTSSCNLSLPGLCGVGQQTCQLNGTGTRWEWGTCVQLTFPDQQAEVCSSSTDEDCDGKVGSADSDCQSCTPALTRACTLAVPGICAAGQQTCSLDSASGRWEWGGCTQLIFAGDRAEDCTTSQDEDCDGAAGVADADCQCTDNSTCSGGLVCLSQTCQECSATSQCSNQQACIAGRCETCTTNGDCGSDYTCQSGQCIHNCVAGSQVFAAAGTHSLQLATGCTEITVKAWAAGGNGSGRYGVSTRGGDGGGGGFVIGDYSVADTATALTVVVGDVGPNYSYSVGGSGGGYSGVLIGGTPIFIAGGGGGGGGTWHYGGGIGGNGGAGGGLSAEAGQPGSTRSGGGGGTQTSGGVSATGGVDPGADGAYLGCGGLPAYGHHGAGQGGCGYWGGGTGGPSHNTQPHGGGGGGGGSGYLAPAVTNGMNIAATGVAPGGAGYQGYQVGVGVGGPGTGGYIGTQGGIGLVIVSWKGK